jgi:hypothetical protein
MAVWVALGYIIFAAVAFRPRGIIGLSVLILLLIPAVFVMVRNQSITGSPFGTAFYTIYNGLGNGAENSVMRTLDLDSETLDLNGIIGKTLRTTLLQTTNIIPFLGGMIIAPLFFISLLHPFKRASIANFRWSILLMWITTAFGLTIFGITTKELDPNQLHILFAPIMVAYGLAFVSILWSRLEFVASTPVLRNVHHIVIIGVCALPLVLSLPLKVRVGMQLRDRGGVPNWPPYYAPAMNSKKTGLKGWIKEKQVTFSDQPWAVAWYADRISVWLPPDRGAFEKIESIAEDLQTPVAGILISPSSHGTGSLADIASLYKDFTFMILDGRTFFTNYPSGVSLFDKDPKIQGIAKRYPFRQPLVGMDMIYYSDRAIRSNQTGEN